MDSTSASQNASGGVRCGEHPEAPAIATCSRCGTFACASCLLKSPADAAVCSRCVARVGVSYAAGAHYHVVPRWRFFLMNVLSFNLYEIYWFYKCWAYVKEREQSSIWVFPRALFARLTYASLLTHLNTHSRLEASPPLKPLSQTLAAGFLLSYFLTRLPEPWFLIAVFVAPLLVLPAVSRIEALNDRRVVAEASGFETRHLVATLIALPVWLLVLLGLVLTMLGLDAGEA